MKCYKVYEKDTMGYEGNITYCKNYNKSIELFNSTLKKAIVDADIVDKVEFGYEIDSFRQFKKNVEIISRKYPYLLYKEKGLLIAQVFYWKMTNCEYDKCDIVHSPVILEEIEIIE